MIKDKEHSKIIRAREITLLQGTLGITVFMASIALGTFVLDLNLVIPLYASFLFFLGLGVYIGYSFDELQETVSSSIKESVPAIMILVSVGALIGTWSMSGIVPTITYYGLNIIKPSILLPATVVVCAVTSLVIGSSWGTIGTVGLAMMGIAKGFEMPAPVMAGAVLSGAYFGDKASPLSDSVILVTTVSRVGVIKHVKNLLPVSVPGILLALVVFYFMGLSYITDQTSDLERISIYRSAIAEGFYVTPFSVLPVFIVITLLWLNVPAVITISIGAAIGVIWGVWVQGADLTYALGSIYSGAELETSSKVINDLFSIGGVQRMSNTLLVIIFGISIAGVLQKLGMLAKACMLIEEHLIYGRFSLVLVTILTAIVVNMLGASMYMSLMLTPKLVYPFYEKYRLSPYLMSRSVEVGGTLTSCWIPWSDNGVFVASTLGVYSWEFIPYYVLPFACFFFALLYARLDLFSSPYQHEKTGKAETDY